MRAGIKHDMLQAARSWRRLRMVGACLLSAAVVAFILPGLAEADFFGGGGSTGLGSANGFAVLGLNDGTTGTTVFLSNVTVNGNVGDAQGGVVNNMAPSTINGNVYLDNTAGNPATYTGPGTLNGSIIHQSMSGIVTDALNANTANGALAATQTFASGITSATTITGNGGLNVIQVNGDITNSVTLSGGANDIFVINVTGTLTLGGSEALLLSGGVKLQNVIYNFTGCSTVGCKTIATHVGNVMDGTFLAPDYTFNLDGTWNGQLIGGPIQIGLFSDATVNGPSPVPEPATLLLLGTGLASLGAWSRKRLLRWRAV